MKGSLILIGVAGLGIAAGFFFTFLSKSNRPPDYVPPAPFKVSDWDGSKLLTLEDVKAMGGDLSSPNPLAYKKEGPAHYYQMGLGELEAKVWSYEKKEGARKRYEEELSDDRKQCDMALNKKMASVAEAKDGRKIMLRSDGWGVVTLCSLDETFVVKVMRCEKSADASALEEIAKRAAQAHDYLIKKLRTSR